MNARALRQLYLDRLVRHAHQHHVGNHAIDRFGPGGEGKVKVGELRWWQELILDHLDDLAWLWDALADDESRRILLESMLFKSLGHLKVKRARHTPDFAAALAGGPSCGGRVQVEQEAAAHVGNKDLHIYRFEQPPVRILASRGFILSHVLCGHYTLDRPTARVAVAPGDTVLDCGACRGDTALWLAGHAGPSGRVHSFEFVPDNLEYFERNLAMNAEVGGRISIIEHAVGETSGVELRFDPRGPGTQVGLSGSHSVTTRSIDDHVQSEALEAVDFIKKDIEGSEDAALRGATHTIRRFHPKLAISAYHLPGDWWTLARRVRAIDPAYRLYFDHHTIYGEETVLYAAVS